MFHSFNDLRRYQLETTDGEHGEIVDVYFDDHERRAKYVLVDIGSWLSDHMALLDIDRLGRIDTSDRRLYVPLTRAQIETSDPPEAHPPVSEQGKPPEALHHRGPLLSLGTQTHVLMPGGPPSARDDDRPEVAADLEERRAKTRDPHLRSMHHLLDARIAAGESRVGRVEDVLFSADDGVVRYLLADTGRILPGASVALAFDWVRDIDAEAREITLSVPPERVEDAPRIEDLRDLDRSRESALYRHFDMPPYWI